MASRPAWLRLLSWVEAWAPRAAVLLRRAASAFLFSRLAWALRLPELSISLRDGWLNPASRGLRLGHLDVAAWRFWEQSSRWAGGSRPSARYSEAGSVS